MKRFLPIIASVIIVSSCSGRDEESGVTPEKQDFTNSNFIKATLKGDWLRTEWSYNGTVWNESGGIYTPGFKSTYSFNDNSYFYKPFTAADNSSMNETGTYSITPVAANNNAFLTLNYMYSNSQFTRKITLLDFQNGVVTVSEINIGSPTGQYFERYKKL